MRKFVCVVAIILLFFSSNFFGQSPNTNQYLKVDEHLTYYREMMRFIKNHPENFNFTVMNILTYAINSISNCLLMNKNDLFVSEKTFMLPEIIGVMKIPPKYLTPGDMICYIGSYLNWRDTGHMMIYAGNDLIVHANPKRGSVYNIAQEGILLTSIYDYFDRFSYVGARRPAHFDYSESQRKEVLQYALEKYFSKKCKWSCVAVKFDHSMGFPLPVDFALDGYIDDFRGWEVFSCTGFIQKAFESVGIDLLNSQKPPILTVSHLFKNTKPVEEIEIFLSGIEFEVNTLEKGIKRTHNVRILDGVGEIENGIYSFFPTKKGSYQVTFEFYGNYKSDIQTLTINVIDGKEKEGDQYFDFKNNPYFAR